MLLDFLMVLDAILAILLIAAVLAQEAPTGMGGFSADTQTVFSPKARGLDALMAKATVVLAILFGILTVIIAKMTSY